MIDFDKRLIIIDHRDYPITEWVVWYQTPSGLVQELGDALEGVRKLFGPDIHAQMYIVPVAVALSDDTMYEVFKR